MIEFFFFFSNVRQSSQANLAIFAFILISTRKTLETICRFISYDWTQNFNQMCNEMTLTTCLICWKKNPKETIKSLGEAAEAIYAWDKKRLMCRMFVESDVGTLWYLQKQISLIYFKLLFDYFKVVLVSEGLKPVTA